MTSQFIISFNLRISERRAQGQKHAGVSLVNTKHKGKCKKQGAWLQDSREFNVDSGQKTQVS